MSDPAPRRRDLLATAAFAMAGVGAVLALYPFVAALGPDAEVRARQQFFELKNLERTRRVTIGVANRPVMIFRRSEEEIVRLRNGTVGGTYRDPNSDASYQPAWAKNWHRSFKPEIMVLDAMCTRGDCVVTLWATGDQILCPCCGSRYDLSGRVFAGPAPRNLRVPKHRFQPGLIEFFESDVLAPA